MKSFTIYIPTRILFGNDKLDEFVEAHKPLGKKGLLVTGGQSAKRLGYFDQVNNAFLQAGMELVYFEGIEPNPVSHTINKAAAYGKQEEVDFVLALGGGSVMDASKAIAGLIHDDEEDIWPFVLGGPKHRRMKGAIPITTVPTTAATASEITPYAVISNPDVNGKSPIGYEFMKPSISWMNPEFTASLKMTTTSDGASDIMSHVFENYLLGGSDSPLADRHTEMVINTVMETLPQLRANPSDYALRGILFWASDIALNGYQLAGRNPSQFVLHAMEHAASGFYPSLAHGRGLATLYPAYFRWLWKNGRGLDRFAQLGERIFGLDQSDPQAAGWGFIEQFEGWLADNDLLQSFESLGLKPNRFEDIADYAVQVYGDGKQLEALGAMTTSDIIEIFNDTARQGQEVLSNV